MKTNPLRTPRPQNRGVGAYRSGISELCLSVGVPCHFSWEQVRQKCIERGEVATQETSQLHGVQRFLISENA